MLYAEMDGGSTSWFEDALQILRSLGRSTPSCLLNIICKNAILYPHDGSANPSLSTAQTFKAAHRLYLTFKKMVGFFFFPP